MDARPATKTTPLPMILGIVGGALLLIGSFLTWATGSFDPTVLTDKIASALGVDPSVIAGQIPTGFSEKVSGFDADGKITLVMGLIVIALAVVVFVKVDLSRALGALILIAGAVGAGVAIYDLVTLNNKKDEALSGLSTAFAGLGVDSSGIGDAFKVSAGIGIWVCILGGLIAVVAGIMALMNKASAAPMTSSMGTSPAPATSGFESSPPVAAPMPTPAAPQPPAPDMTPSTPDAPSAPDVSMPSTPEAPSAPETGGEPGSGSPTA